MDAIKSKMKKLASETEDATIKANKFEDESNVARGEAEKIEQSLATLQKKYQSQESAFDVAVEDLFNLSIKLEEREKVLANAEGEVGSGIRRIFLLEGEAEKRENRLATEVSSLLRASLRADEQMKAKNTLEAAISNNEEDIDELENHLKEARFVLAESERKYEDINRKYVNIETDSQRAVQRADEEEHKIIELEDELRIVGSNLQQLEVSEEKALEREEVYQKQIDELIKRLVYFYLPFTSFWCIFRLKMAETRAENSEMNIQRLNIRIDQIEDELIHEKMKIKAVCDDVDGTFKQMGIP